MEVKGTLRESSPPLSADHSGTFYTHDSTLKSHGNLIPEKTHRSYLLPFILFFLSATGFTALALWQPTFIKSGISISSAHFASPSRAVAVGSAGTILRSEDGGETWSSVSSGTSMRLLSVRFADSIRALAVGYGGTILRSDDGGKTWNKVSLDSTLVGSDTEIVFHSVHFADPNNVLLVGENGVILRSENGGKTWDFISRAGPLLWSVHYTEKFALAVGKDGIIRRSENGGKTWNSVPSGTNNTLGSVYFTDPKLALAVGDKGTILRSEDGGKTWMAVSSGTTLLLRAVCILDSGRALAIGEMGTILLSEDGGISWKIVPTGTKDLLTSLDFFDHQTLTVGRAGTVLHSEDGGRSWRNLVSRNMPAWWLYLFLIIDGALCLRWARKRQTATLRREPSVADKLVSDNPIDAVALDKLRMCETVQGVIKFLRNSATRPPMTIAVCGPWGSGKSSLLGLIRQELISIGVYPVWFNAWHHQKEPSLLAVLLESIRGQAIPNWRHPLIWFLFFVKRIYLRAKQSPFETCFIVFLLILGIKLCHAFWPAEGWTISLMHFLGNLNLSSGKIEWKKVPFTLLENPHLIGGLAIILCGVVVWNVSSVAPNLLLSFPLSPGKLLAIMTGKFDWRQAEDQAAFRNAFAKQYSTVCKALAPRYPCLFIDDLDRCQPEKALEVLEAINFLVTSGPCFVLLGIDRERVERLVGLALKPQAHEMITETPTIEQLDTQANAPDAIMLDAKGKRRRFAQEYLEKMINLDIPVHPLNYESAKRLLDIEDISQKHQHRFTWLDRICRFISIAWSNVQKYFVPLIPSIIVIFIALIFEIQFTSPNFPINILSSTQNNSTLISREQSSNTTIDTLGHSPVTNVPNGFAVGPNKANHGIPWRAFIIPCVIFILFLLIFFFDLARYRQHTLEKEDSPEFLDALAIWVQVISNKTPTPRAIKRYTNRTRYYAMRRRGMQPRLTPTQILHKLIGKRGIFAWLLSNLLPETMNNSFRNDEQPNPLEITESTLVALSAIKETYPEYLNWLEETEQNNRGHFDQYIGNELSDAIEHHDRKFGLYISQLPQETLHRFRIISS